MELKWSSNGAQNPVDLKWSSNGAQMEVKRRRELVLNDPGGLMGRGYFMTPEVPGRCQEQGESRPGCEMIQHVKSDRHAIRA